MSTIYGNMVGGASMAQTYILQDPNGKEIPAVLVEEPTVLDATANDIREGKVAATETGVVTGEKVIPSYHTTEGVQVIPNGSIIKIVSLKDLNLYEFTKMQAIICDFNTSLSNSTAASKISINENVYEVRSIDSLSTIIKNNNDKSVDFGIANSTGNPQILRFITYKEIE